MFIEEDSSILILTPENGVFEMNEVYDTVPDAMYSALDLSSVNDSDFYFFNILNTVSFSAMSAELQIGDYIMSVPINWQILLGDEESGMMEMSTIEDLLSLVSPHAFITNPISSLYPRYLPVKVRNIFTINARWQMPMLNKKHLLSVPLYNKHKPLCAFFADESDKITDFFIGE